MARVLRLTAGRNAGNLYPAPGSGRGHVCPGAARQRSHGPVHCHRRHPLTACHHGQIHQTYRHLRSQWRLRPAYPVGPAGRRPTQRATACAAGTCFQCGGNGGAPRSLRHRKPAASAGPALFHGFFGPSARGANAAQCLLLRRGPGVGHPVSPFGGPQCRSLKPASLAAGAVRTPPRAHSRVRPYRQRQDDHHRGPDPGNQ